MIKGAADSENPKERIVQFLEWVGQFEGRNMLYRGFSRDDDYVTASLQRRLESNNPKDITHQRFIAHTDLLVSDARMNGYGQKDGNKLSDLEILAELQHFDAATCLVDFTCNPLVALWFACKQSTRKSNKKQSFCGKVIALDRDAEFCIPVYQPEQMEEKIKVLLSVGKDEHQRQTEKALYVWAPHHQNKRIIAQQSVFVFGKSRIDDYHGTMKIAKDGMNAELQKLGISADSLFCDFHGFARNNSLQYSNEDALKIAERDYRIAHRLRLRGDHDTALYYYDQALKESP